MRTLSLIASVAVTLTGCVSESEAQLSNGAGKSGDSVSKTLEFEIGTDGSGYVVGDYENGKLQKATVSFGLSNAHLSWQFTIDAGTVVRFSVIRSYYAWNADEGTFTLDRIDHERKVDYVLEGKGFTKEIPNDGMKLADDQWSKTKIERVFHLVRDYLSFQNRDTFEKQLEMLVK